jgi:hypothetical protein
MAFSQVLGQPCQAIEGQSTDFNPRNRAVLTPILNALGGAQGLAICDQDLAVFLVAASRGQHRETLQNALSAPFFVGEDLSKLQEILAPLAKLMASDGAIFSVGLGWADPSAERSPDVEAVLQSPAHRLDLQVTVQGYGLGRLSLLTV